MTTTELNVKIEALQAALDTKTQEQDAYRGQIDALKIQLEDLNKPKLTMKQFDQLTESIEEGVEEFNFDDLDNYSIDYGIDYDNRVTCESFCFDNVDELARVIFDKVYTMFAEVKESEDDSDNS